MSYANLLVEIREHVGLVTLNRPQALNALNGELLTELADALRALDADAAVGALVLTGAGRAFAAGADIKAMAGASADDLSTVRFVELFDGINDLNKPLVAAVHGYALGGGCELALACDMIVAGESARFGLPEVTIGVIPGAGGTQRLPRVVGKALAMEMILNERRLTAAEAMQFGLVNRVVPDDRLLDETLALAGALAARAPLAARAARRMVLRAFETPLEQGLAEERRAFYDLFSTRDQKEGMAAFIEKRKPEWKGE